MPQKPLKISKKTEEKTKMFHGKHCLKIFVNIDEITGKADRNMAENAEKRNNRSKKPKEIRAADCQEQ